MSRRTVQMAQAGVPSARQKSKFRGFRGVGSPERRKFAAMINGHRNNWRDGEPVIRFGGEPLGRWEARTVAQGKRLAARRVAFKAARAARRVSRRRS